MTAPARPRDDILVSIALSAPPSNPAAIAELSALAKALDTRFRYWEILVGYDAERDTLADTLHSCIPNLRLLQLRAGSGLNQRRLAVASEAIGDVVLLSTEAELAYLDLPAMIEMAQAHQALVIGQHSNTNLMGSLATAMGRGAGLAIGPHDMLSIAFPRPLLGIVLAHPDRLLALRFPPIDKRLPIIHQAITPATDAPRFQSGSEAGPLLFRRMEILHRLTISSAPRVLTLVALSGLLATGGGLLFALYSILAWLIIENVQPGWFTTSMALSMTAGFLGFAIFGLSIGLRRLLEAVTGSDENVVIDEAAPIDLFSKVMHEFNVEIAMQQDQRTPPTSARSVAE